MTDTVGAASSCFRPARRRDQRGFTLIETLVAFVVLVLVLAVILQISSRGARSERLAAEYARATVIANNRLVLLDEDGPLAETTRKGRIDGRYDWELRVRPAQVENPVADPGPVHTYIPFDVHVSVYWDSGGRSRKLTIDTLRLANRR